MKTRAAAACSVLVAGCAGGGPLLHGAHALGPGATAQGAGFSGTFAAGDVKAAARAARSADRDAAADAIAPGVAPWVGARVGIGGENEAGLTYTGRSLRLDARHAFEDGPRALSIGAGVSGILRSSDERRYADGSYSTSPWGFGFDVPILVGWRSDAGVVTLWAGARGGIDSIRWSDVDLQHRYIGTVTGLGLGFRHVHAALELDAYYQSVSGSLSGDDVRLSGLTLAPAAALLLTF